MSIYPENPINQIELTNFEVNHNNHMIQTVSFNKIPKEYECKKLNKSERD